MQFWSYGRAASSVNNTEEKKEDKIAKDSQITAGYAATQSAYESTQAAAIKYGKPDSYVGNRTAYDSGAAKVAAKRKLFKENVDVRDPYTGDKLVLTKQEAKALYGDEWARHLAESDHVKPLEKIYEDTKGNTWNTVDDIKQAANSQENIKVASRKFNNAKRSKTNKEYVENEEYIASKDVRLTKEGKQQAIKDGEMAETAINSQLRNAAVKNVISTGHQAGVQGAQSAGISSLTVSGIMNVVAVIKGEKSGEDAVKDTVKDAGKAAVSGYAMSSGLTVVSHTLSGAKSEFVRGLAKSNIPGKVITAVIATGDTLKKWGTGEINTQECMIELGAKGLNMLTVNYAMAMGQAIIPIPIVGGAIGALVGSMLTSTYYENLISTLQTKKLEHEERLRIIKECNEAAEQAIAFRKELEIYLDNYFQEYRECFESALSTMRFAYETGDADGMISSANQITRKLGGQVKFENVEGFKSFLNSSEIDIL